MKKYLFLFLLFSTAMSCKSAWNQSEDDTFRKACIDDAKTWAGSAENAGIYCDCVIAKVKQKYPDKNEAMKNISTLSTDKDFQTCRDSLVKK